MRRGAALLLAAVLALLAGCGGGGGSSGTTGGGAGHAVSDKAADAEVLGGVLSRELAVIDAYDRVLPQLRGADLALGRQFRSQEQEHVDAILKALRGLGAKAEPEEEEIERSGLQSRDDVLDFLYEVESVSIDQGLFAIANFIAPWPRKLVGSIVANQAQHLVLLRRALGARPLALVPEGFENGTAPPPSGNGAR
ncbi:MAG TPA: ferritin-like domain-containing protein [Solirubrobacterales bacterium]|nr:ferritin-like domain-containing protein [Solirubrobacterales bacterium]